MLSRDGIAKGSQYEEVWKKNGSMALSRENQAEDRLLVKTFTQGQ